MVFAVQLIRQISMHLQTRKSRSAKSLVKPSKILSKPALGSLPVRTEVHKSSKSSKIKTKIGLKPPINADTNKGIKNENKFQTAGAYARPHRQHLPENGCSTARGTKQSLSSNSQNPQNTKCVIGSMKLPPVSRQKKSIHEVKKRWKKVA